MARYQYVVLTSPAEGQDNEYNEWYSNTHLGEILQIPGFKSAKRYKVAARSTPLNPPPKQSYLALYEMETDDPEATLGELRRRSAAGLLKSTTSMDRTVTSSILYELIAEREAK